MLRTIQSLSRFSNLKSSLSGITKTFKRSEYSLLSADYRCDITDPVTLVLLFLDLNLNTFLFLIFFNNKNKS
jgi:hypothetical protein